MTALAASSLLLIDYVRPSPVFCAAEGGCGVVRRTVFAYPLGIPTPLFGIGGFLAMGLAQLLPGGRARAVQASLASFGAAVALVLLGVQAYLKTVCPFCLVADVSALLVFGLSVARLRFRWDPPQHKVQLVGAAALTCAAIGVPTAVGMSKKTLPADFPAVIAEEMRKTAPGKVTVVEFVDFECPFCRMTHAAFHPLLTARKDQVRVVRRHVPLRMHPHAMDAARTACCGEAMGKGDEVAEALFATDVAELTHEGCEALAARTGLDVVRFRECFTSAETEARIKADSDMFRAALGHGLPTIYMDSVRLEGAQESSVLSRKLDAAVRAL